jgi:hypothetical protein
MKKSRFTFRIIIPLSVAAIFACQNINVDTSVVDPCTFTYSTDKYSLPFDLVIENDDMDVEIWYTVDGTTPTQYGSTSAEYTGPVHIAKTTTVKAKGYKPGLQASNVSSAVYTFVWTRGTDMPGADGYLGRSTFGCTELGGKIYCIGGWEKYTGFDGAVKTVLVYDPVSDVWDTATYAGKIYIIGGADSSGALVGTVEEFDTDGGGGSGAWTLKASMPTARYGHKLAVLGDKIFAFGGYNGTQLDTVEAYDPVGNTWSTCTSMPVATMEFGIGVVSGKAYVFGGATPTGVTKEAYVFDSTLSAGAGSWSKLTDMPETGLNQSAIVCADIIYSIGRSYNGSASTMTNYMFNPAIATGSESWAEKTSIPVARDYFGISTYDAKVFVISGYSSDGSSMYYSRVDIYEPAVDY